MKKNNVVWKSGGTTEWETPRHIFKPLQEEFDLEIDVCAIGRNKKLPRYWDAGVNALNQQWNGMRCWMNPPYGRGRKKGIYAWVEKAAQIQKGVVVALLPVRTGTQWWQRFVLHHAEIRYLPGRIYFIDSSRHPAPYPAGFDSAIVIWDHTHWTLNMENDK